MKIFGISDNRFNFTGLVPKSQYSGTPRLSKEAITGIEKIRTMMKQADIEMLELESQMNSVEGGGSIQKYLKKKLGIIKFYKMKLLKEMNNIKKKGTFEDKNLNAIQKNKSNLDKKCESYFDKIVEISIGYITPF